LNGFNAESSGSFDIYIGLEVTGTLVFVLMAYLFSNINDIYRFSEELCWIAGTNFFVSIARDVLVYFSANPMIIILTITLKDLLFFYFMIVKPTRGAKRFHFIMPTTMKLNEEVDKFIEDGVCYKLFYAFVEQRANRAKGNEKYNATESLQLLNFISQILIAERTQLIHNFEHVKGIINTYFGDADLFPLSIKESILNKMKDTSDTEREELQLLLRDAVTYAYGNLIKVHREFQNTASWRELKRQLEINEKYYDRLSLFGMFK
jgi:hypothetical protein